MTDYKEFFDNLKTDEMPVMDKILKKIEDYIEVERVSDEEALDESNHISFSLKIKEFKDSLIKISSTKDDSDISETEVYSYINGDWVNILFNNSLYLKYYGKSYFRNDNKWRKAITFGSLLDGKVNGDNLIDIINLYISKKLNFHNDEMYVYDRIRVNDMSEIDHLDDLVYHKDLKNVNDIDKNRSNKLLFDLAFNMSTVYYIDYRFHLDGYMRDMMIDLIDNKNAAIRRSIKCGEYNAILFPDIEKDKHYFGRNMPIREITDNKGQIYTVFQYGGTWPLYRSGMSPESMTEIMKGMNTAFDNISRSGRDDIPEEFVLKKIEGKDLYRLVGMLDGNDKIIKFNNPLHLMELFRIDYIIDIEDSLSRNIGDYEKRGRIENVIEYYH